MFLEGILREQLKGLNRITYKGCAFLFSEENIQTAIRKLKIVKYDGLLRKSSIRQLYLMMNLNPWPLKVAFTSLN